MYVGILKCSVQYVARENEINYTGNIRKNYYLIGFKKTKLKKSSLKTTRINQAPEIGTIYKRLYFFNFFTIIILLLLY